MSLQQRSCLQIPTSVPDHISLNTKRTQKPSRNWNHLRSEQLPIQYDISTFFAIVLNPTILGWRWWIGSLWIHPLRGVNDMWHPRSFTGRCSRPHRKSMGIWTLWFFNVLYLPRSLFPKSSENLRDPDKNRTSYFKNLKCFWRVGGISCTKTTRLDCLT